MKPTIILSDNFIKNFTGTIEDLNNIKKTLSQLSIDDFENLASSMTFDTNGFDKIITLNL